MLQVCFFIHFTYRPGEIIKGLPNNFIGIMRDLIAYSVYKGLNCLIPLYELPIIITYIFPWQ